MNHELSERQKEEVLTKLRAKNIFSLPEKLKEIWLNLSPYSVLDIRKLNEIITWLKGKASLGDYVLVQGEFGATFYLVDFCFKYGLVPLYATSKREYNELTLKDGFIKRIHIFNHIQFREYKRYMEE